MTPKLDKNGQRRGGKREGAGRPPKGDRSSERHKIRAAFTPDQAIHAVMRTASDVGSLRKRDTYEAIRAAMVTSYARALIRIVHLSIQESEVHLIVEANNRLELARGMQGFLIAAARHINAAIGERRGERRRGTVFPDRYHATILKYPRQARGALAYVINNWRRHGEHKAAAARRWAVDPFSTAPSFDGFRDVDTRALTWDDDYVPLPVWEPRTALLSIDWRKYGLVVSTETPDEGWMPTDVQDGKRAMRAPDEPLGLTD